MTYADYFRHIMTNEEMAKFLSGAFGGGGKCPPHSIEGCRAYLSCTKCWLDWLKQEVQDEAN